MNCSEFDRELERLVETRGSGLPESAAAHAAECLSCRARWQDHQLVEAALLAWRPVQCPTSLADSVLTQLVQDASPVRQTREDRSRWVAVAAAAACLIAVLGFGMASLPQPAHNNVAQDTGRPQVPVASHQPIEVASSMAAVLDDLQAEYRELAAETSATARELAEALPATPTAPWIDGGLTSAGNTAAANAVEGNPDNTREVSQGAVSVIGRSFGSQIGQAMDFLRVAVPDSVPRG